jgi:hypothetical protein
MSVYVSLRWMGVDLKVFEGSRLLDVRMRGEILLVEMGFR